jgi:DNA-directed RNA polymerase subunit H
MDKKASRTHILIPKHTKISEKEKKELLDKYGINATDLPSIMKSDPAIAGMDVKEGDVIRIDRKSGTAGKTVFHRGVVNG